MVSPVMCSRPPIGRAQRRAWRRRHPRGAEDQALPEWRAGALCSRSLTKGRWAVSLGRSCEELPAVLNIKPANLRTPSNSSAQREAAASSTASHCRR